MREDKIPNGYVRRGAKGKCAFVGIDEKGKCDNKSKDFFLTTGWEDVMVNGEIRDDVVVLVRLCGSNGNMTMRKLFILSAMEDGKPISINSMDKMNSMIEKIWKERVEEIKYFEKLSMELYNDCVKDGIL